jgi:hypothetical protein
VRVTGVERAGVRSSIALPCSSGETRRRVMPVNQTGQDRVAEVARRFAGIVDLGELDVPLSGSGRTRSRWSMLADLAQHDLCVGRLAEAHVDAMSILADLDWGSPPAGSRWGVWAAHPAEPALKAQGADSSWRLDGTKPWCSGARVCTHALVTADAPDGYRLFAVDLREGVLPRPGTWHSIGMAGSDNLEVEFANVAALPVGEPGDYVDRPGFWHGAMAVASCWYGGTVGLAQALVAAGSRRELGPHALAHLGAIDAALSSLAKTFDFAADQVDADPADLSQRGEILAGELRAQTERVAWDVLDRVGRALGPGPLCLDAEYAALSADLPVYLRQSHAEADLERLGALVLERGPSW